MELKIGETIRRLRREKDVTQEEFAARIGVSAQAVSKWERTEGYPDITLLPAIAGFFGITLDTLCGIDKEKEKADIENIIHEAWKPGNGGCDRSAEILREGLARYPHSDLLVSELAYALTGHSTMEGRREAVHLYEDLQAHCTDPAIRKSLGANLSTAYARIGEKDKAIATAEQLPNLYKTIEVEMADLLTGDALTDFLQNEAFQKVVWCFYFWVRKLCTTGNYTTSENLSLLAKASAFYDLVYENHDHNFGLRRQLTLWQDGAEIALEAGMVEEALACLEQSAHFAILHDALPMGEYRPTSLLVNRCTFNREWNEVPGGRDCRALLLSDLRTEERYIPLQDTIRFGKILHSLEA